MMSLTLRPVHLLKIIYLTLIQIGINPLNTVAFLRGVPVYLYQAVQFYLKSRASEHALPIAFPFPCVVDRYQNAGSISKHYFYQDLWAARKVYQNNPEHHVDVGSRIDGFVAHLLTFRQVEVLDVRPMTSQVPGMSFRQADLMQIDSVPEAICDSVSCLHALEHFGLGRYGDPIAPEGHVKGLSALTKLLKPGGKLLLSVPIGKERVEFNGHRVFAVDTILALTKGDYDLISFSFINDQNEFYENVSTDVSAMTYGCGLFDLRKL
jgi:SAM-dependent methyltransferase